jgi:hypothetical protein
MSVDFEDCGGLLDCRYGDSVETVESAGRADA